MKKRFLSTGLCLAVTVSLLFGCGSSDSSEEGTTDQEKDSYKVGYATKTLSGGFWQRNLYPWIAGNFQHLQK